MQASAARRAPGSWNVWPWPWGTFAVPIAPPARAEANLISLFVPGNSSRGSGTEGRQCLATDIYIKKSLPRSGPRKASSGGRNADCRPQHPQEVIVMHMRRSTTPTMEEPDLSHGLNHGAIKEN